MVYIPKKILFIFVVVCIWFNPAFVQASVEYHPTTKAKDIDLSKDYSGSFDINFDDNYSSSRVEDFFDYSRHFYQHPEDLLLEKERYSELELIEHFLHIHHKNVWSNLKSKITRNDYPSDYIEIRSFIVDLLTRHYKDLNIDENKDVNISPKNVYVFISTSPLSSVISFVEALKTKSDVINRNSTFKKSLDSSIFIDVPYDIKKFNGLSDTADTDLYRHFSKYIDPSILEGNNVIVVDLVRSGMNAGSFIRNLKRYMLYSGVHEASFSSDLFTFYPPNLYNSFLNKLSMYPFINIIYKDSYWNFLMKNLYLSGYDDAHIYYDNLLDRYYYLEDEEFKKAYEEFRLYFRTIRFDANDGKIKFLDSYVQPRYKDKKLKLNFLEGRRLYTNNDRYDAIFWDKDFWYRCRFMRYATSTRIFSTEDEKRYMKLSVLQLAYLSFLDRGLGLALGLPSKIGVTMIPYNIDANSLEDNESFIYSKYESDWISYWGMDETMPVKKEFKELIQKYEQMIEKDGFFRELESNCPNLFIRLNLNHN